MKEAFLHYLWKFKKIDFAQMHTAAGERVVVKQTGTHNTDAGPDFLNARVRIGETLWAGHVEIHLQSSDWNRHEHQHDKAYNNVILHVVYEHDATITNEAGRTIPTVELKSLIDPQTVQQYQRFLQSNDWIPCEQMIGGVAPFTIESWLERLMIERLENKTSAIDDLLTQTRNNWEAAFYITLARYFGMKTNAFPFEQLARHLPLRILARHKSSRFQIEALLFGQAGLLRDVFNDQYPRTLQMEYDHLRQKYDLQPINGSTWRFLRLRPANFPTIRLSQFAALIHESSHLLSKLLEVEKTADLRALFQVEASEYWTTHYQFDSESKKRPKRLGAKGIDHLLINVVVPFLFHYGKRNDKAYLQDRALDLLASLKPEQNGIIRKWKELLPTQVENAFQSQALLTLKHDYCDERRCLHCAVGAALIG